MAKYRKKYIYHPRFQPIGGHITINHPLYSVWSKMIDRCENTTGLQYADYGGRGITVCRRWRYSFESFVNDMGPKPTPGHSLDRVNNDKGYSPDNCRWATRSEQMRNRRKFSNNTSSETGVVSVKGGRFNARFDHEGVRYNLGRFESAENAAAYRAFFIAAFAVDREAALLLTERRARFDSSTGVRGITRHTDGFMVRKTIDGVRVYLGFRKTFEEAQALWNEHN